MGIESCFDRVARLVERIIDEEPYPDPAIGGLHDAIDDNPAGRVAFPKNRILHVETSLGEVGQGQADETESTAPVVQEAKAGKARMLVGRRAKKLAQVGQRGSRAPSIRNGPPDGLPRHGGISRRHSNISPSWDGMRA